MRVSIGYSGSTRLPATLPVAAAADAAGLHGIWSAEHIGMNDGVVPSATYAAMTEGLEIGVMGLNADTRSPGVLAMELSTLAQLAPGRVRIHVGTGSPQRARLIGVRERRTLHGVEMFVSVLRRLLRGETVTAATEAFALDQMTITTVDPELPAIPIDVMAIRPKMTSLAARVGDGLSLSVCASHDYLRSQVRLAERVLEDAGREREAFRVSAAVLAAIDPDIEKARATMRTVLASFPPGIPEMLAGVEVPDASSLDAARAHGGIEAAGQLFGESAVEALGIVATPDGLGDALARYAADGLDEVIVLPCGAPEDHPEVARLLGAAQ